MVNLMPMAGQGMRFLKEGYSTPKPLIEVSGKPMIIQAASALPDTDKWLFICRKEMIENDHIDSFLKEYYPDSQVISIDYLTQGQASTCLLGEKFIDTDESLLIGTCDAKTLWDKNLYYKLVADNDVDALIWTFRNNAAVKRDPRMYGWVVVDDDNNVLKVSCKVPISDNPVKDHAIIGIFYFKKASYFFDAARKMIGNNRRINNEFYVDEAMNEVIEAGLRVKVFEADKYICWGTPDDLKAYDYWRTYFQKVI